MAIDESKELNIDENAEVSYTDQEKDQFYEKAIFKMKSTKLSDWETAVACLREIPGWRDADEKLVIAQERYGQMKDQYQTELLEKQRKIDWELKEQEINRKDKRQYGLFLLVLGLLILILLIASKK